MWIHESPWSRLINNNILTQFNILTVKWISFDFRNKVERFTRCLLKLVTRNVIKIFKIGSL